MTSCWRCDRAIGNGAGRSYVFGLLCNRADCRPVGEALSLRHQWFWFKLSLPAETGDRGRVGSYSLDGDPQNPRGMGEMSTMRKIEADRRVNA